MESRDELENPGDGALQSDNFSPSDIRERIELVSYCGDEHTQLRASARLADVNAMIQCIIGRCLKKQFIDASKEISRDDKTSIQTASSHTASINSVTPIQVLMQKMDGIASILNNMRSTDKVLLYGEMMLLDPETKEDIHRAMLVLLTDRLLIGNITPSGKYRYFLHHFAVS
ncbi:hypothetical protein OSTOST_06502, partial [Ostertagia ostertagi]